MGILVAHTSDFDDLRRNAVSLAKWWARLLLLDDVAPILNRCQDCTEKCGFDLSVLWSKRDQA
jgi:hypothetical protein